MAYLRFTLPLFLMASLLSGCAGEQVRMPWQKAAVERATPEVVVRASTPGMPASAPVAPAPVAPAPAPAPAPVPELAAASPVAEKAKAAPAIAEAAVKAPEAQKPVPATEATPEPSPTVMEMAPLATPKLLPVGDGVSVPSVVASVTAVEPPMAASIPPVPPISPVSPVPPYPPVDALADLRVQARSAQEAGEAEVAEALWQMIQQQAPEDVDAKAALAAIEQARLKQVKTQDRVILLGENEAGWVVQVATYRADGREQAFEWLGRIRKAGYKPFLKTVEFPGRTLYRLRLGAYPERWMAEEVERRLLSNFPDSTLRPRIMRQDG